MRMLIALFLAVAAPTLYDVTFSVRGDRARGWPVKMKVALTSASGGVEKTIVAADARKPLTLSVAPGLYRLIVTAAGHRKYERLLDVDENLSLREIALAPVPAISGRVITRLKELELPPVGAPVMRGTRQLATTNAQGPFRAEATHHPPPEH